MNVAKAAYRAAFVFTFLKWKWSGPNGDVVPGILELYRCIKELIEEAEAPETDWVETGHLLVIEETEEGRRNIKVCLVLAESGEDEEE